MNGFWKEYKECWKVTASMFSSEDALASLAFCFTLITILVMLALSGAAITNYFLRQ